MKRVENMKQAIELLKSLRHHDDHKEKGERFELIQKTISMLEAEIILCGASCPKCGWSVNEKGKCANYFCLNYGPIRSSEVK